MGKDGILGRNGMWMEMKKMEDRIIKLFVVGISLSESIYVFSYCIFMNLCS